MNNEEKWAAMRQDQSTLACVKDMHYHATRCIDKQDVAGLNWVINSVTWCDTLDDVKRARVRLETIILGLERSQADE